MNHTAKRIAQAAVVAALLETVVATIRSHSFYPVSIAMYAVMEIVYFLVVICVAALLASQIRRPIGWVQRILFFVVMLAPSLFSIAGFFRGVTYYWQNGADLVIDHQMTSAGYKDLVLSGIASAVIALIATFIYFRGSKFSKLTQVSG